MQADLRESRGGIFAYRLTWLSNAARFSSFRGKPSMSTCCLPPFSMAASSRLMVTCRVCGGQLGGWPAAAGGQGDQAGMLQLGTMRIRQACCSWGTGESGRHWNCSHPRGHDLALLDHVGHHVAVGRARLHVRAQQVPRAQVQQPKFLHDPGALRCLAQEPRVKRCARPAIAVVCFLDTARGAPPPACPCRCQGPQARR